MENTLIYAYKHDGSFHRMWKRSQIIKETKDYIITYVPQFSLVYEKKGKIWKTKEDAICYFSKKRWFNIISMLKKDEIVYYCNLASPVLYEQNSLKYIDYDLDLKYFPSIDYSKILDRNEFNINKNEYNYGEYIENKVEKELKTLQQWTKNKIGPFDEENINEWIKIAKGSKNE